MCRQPTAKLHALSKVQARDDEDSKSRAPRSIEQLYSCRAGSCSSCAGKVVSDSIDQSDQTFLDDDQMEEGFCVTCVTYPTSDVTIKTHVKEQI